MPLFFVLGLFATLLRSDLKVPELHYMGLMLYLLAAIGLKGGAEIRAVGFTAIWLPMLFGIPLYFWFANIVWR
jgi:hypothetical protein